MTTAAPPVYLDRIAFDLMTRALDALTGELRRTVGGPVKRAALYQGSERAAMDVVAGGGQAAVRLHRIYPVTDRVEQQDFSQRGRASLHRGKYAVVIEMTVYRQCAVFGSDHGEPPTPAQLRHEVAVQLDDAAAMRRAARCVLAPAFDDRVVSYMAHGAYLEEDYYPVGPEGDGYGGYCRFAFAVYDVDCACPPLVS